LHCVYMHTCTVSDTEDNQVNLSVYTSQPGLEGGQHW